MSSQKRLQKWYNANVKNEAEPRQNLSPEQQLLIAAKVSRLCQVTPQTFDELAHVADAQDIVRALDPIIKPANVKSRHGYGVSSSNSQVRAGATNAGSINANFNERQTRQWSKGIDLYKIGKVSAVKSALGYRSVISLNNWTYEELAAKIVAGGELQQGLTNLQIEYDLRTLEVVRINQMVPKIKQRRLRNTFEIKTQEQAIVLWKKPDYVLPPPMTHKMRIKLRIR